PPRPPPPPPARLLPAVGPALPRAACSRHAAPCLRRQPLPAAGPCSWATGAGFGGGDNGWVGTGGGSGPMRWGGAAHQDVAVVVAAPARQSRSRRSHRIVRPRSGGQRL